jgi:phage N-6-adenine-methyltransferase
VWRFLGVVLFLPCAGGVAVSPAKRKMPKQKRGSSEQTVETPPEFIDAVQDTFGPFSFDLAATPENAQARLHFGPGAPADRENSLTAKWPEGCLSWLNPPYDPITPWAQKCAIHARRSKPQTHILMLVPASVGANWYRDYVLPFADVYSVGRLHFIGSPDPYPKDLVLCHYWALGGHKFKHWNWLSAEAKATRKGRLP